MSTFSVTSTADGVPGSLRYELGLANTTSGNNTISFDSGLFATAQTIALTGGPLELSNTTGTETIVGPAAGLTINGGGQGPVLKVDHGVMASISGLTITGGSATGFGGGLANVNGTVTMTGCTISGNTAASGGGVYTAAYGKTNLYGCTISGNVAKGNGGGVYNYAGTMTLTNCVVSGNSAAGQGGGLYDLVGGLTITDVVVSSNTAANGGGLAILFGTTTLTGCNFTGDVASSKGGGLYNNGGTNTLTNCSFTRNLASVDGGGLYNNASGTVALTGGTFSGNSAASNGGALSNAGTTTLSNCTISGNTAGAGGGLYGLQGTSKLYGVTVSANVAANGAGLAENGGTTTLTNCLVSGNSANGEGGGLLNTSGTANLINSVVTGNSATSSGGLGTYASGTTSLTGSTVSGNMATSTGGGVGNNNSVTTLFNSTVSGNSAATGGGLITDNKGLTTVTDSTVSGNTAQAGGGLYITSGGTSTLIGATVAANSATNGGGLDNVGGTVKLGNTIVADNAAATSGPDALGAVNSLGTNLVGEDDGSSGWVSSDLTGTIAHPLNPLVAPLGSYGGPTQTMALLPGSPAINAGTNALIPSGVTTDERSLARIVGGTVDIGAFESNLFQITAISGSGQSTGILTAFPAPLVAIVTANNALEPVAGGLVTFSPPQTGASAILAGDPATILANGTVSVGAAANGVVGRYTVSAGALGITNTASFTLTNQAIPTIVTTPNVTSVTLGTSPVTLTDTATLAQGYFETGTITFTLYLNGTLVDTETATVNGDGNYTTPAGYTLPSTGSVTGTYQWNASYAGDPFNIPTAESNATTERTVVSPANPTIVTTSSEATVTLAGSPVILNDSAVLSGGYHEGGTITFTLYLGSTLVDTESVAVNGNGTYTTPTGYTLPTTGTVTGTYQWDASYSGSPNNNPAGESGATAEQTVVNPASPSIVTTSSAASLTLGTTAPTLQDTAVLSGGYHETGTITFSLYLGSTLVDTESVAVNGDGTYSTPTGYTLPTTGTVTGTYQWNASYSGDANNNAAGESYAPAEQTVVHPASPSIATTSSVAALTLGTSAPTLNDTAVLSGGYYEGGTITFSLYLGSTLMDTESVAVHGDGTYSTPTGYTLPTTGAVTGTYQWNASYSGSPNNNPASESGAVAEQTVVHPASPSIATTSSAASLTLGTTAPTLNDTATLTGGYYQTGTITFSLYLGSTLVDTESVAVNGNGTYSTPAGYTLPTTGTVAGTYQWNAAFSGDANNAAAGESGAVAEQTVVNPAAPSLTTTSSTAAIALGAATPPTLNDTAVLTGGYYEGGTITFTLHLGNTVVDTESVSVHGNGTYSTPTGYALPTTGTVTGTYQWVATYGGDANNATAHDQGGTSEQTVVNSASPSIATTSSAASLTLGTSSPTLIDTALLSGGYFETGTITFTLVGPGGTTLDTEAVPVHGNGTYTTPTGYTLPTSGAVTGTYQWNASFSGDTNNATTSEANAPAERTVILAASPSIATTPSAAGMSLGSTAPTLKDTATLSGGYFETGTITFTLVGPGGTTLDTETVPVSGNGSYTTPTGYTLPTTGSVTGTYQWNSSYSGDANDNSAGESNATTEQTRVNLASPALSTTASPASVTLSSAAPAPLNDTAALVGGYYPTGTITFTLTYNNAVVYTDHVAVNGNGTYSTAAGDHAGGYSIPTTGTVVGTYQWSAVYSGDTNDTTAQDQGGSAEQNTVNPASPSITTIPGAAVPIGFNVSLTDSATLSGGYNTGGTITFYLFAPGITPNGTDSNNVYSDTVTVAGNGTYTTATGTHPGGFIPTTAGIYEWVAVYSGDSNNNGATSPYGSEPELAGSPNLAVTKTADQSTIRAGQTAGYTVTITNNGNVTATGVTLTDPLPAGAGGDINWTIDTSQGSPNDFVITGPQGGQSLALSTYFITTSGDGLTPGQTISVHITSPTAVADAGSNTTFGGAAAYLGGAANYSVLYEGTGGHNIQITNVTTYGNIGVGGTGHVQFNGPGIIGGRVDFSASNTGQFSNNNAANVGPSSVNYGVTAVTTALNTVNHLSSSLAGLAGTNVAIIGNQTINESAGQLDVVNGVAYRVFNVTSYSEGNGNLVTLNGDGSGDPVVLNFGFNSNVGLGGDVSLTGGLSDDQVLWNFTTSGLNISLTNNASSYPLPLAFHGIVLAPNDAISTNNSSFEGRIFGGNSSDMQIVSGDYINYPPGTLPNTATVTSTDNIPGRLTASATITVSGQVAPVPVSAGMFGTIGFWQNPNGQATIKSFNGGSTSTQLGNWLASNFPNLFGASNPYIASTLSGYGATSLAGLTNAQIATVYKNLWNPSGTTKNTYVQAFAVALGLYGDNASLGGDATAQGFGFRITAAGASGAIYNVGSYGAVFGVPNNSGLSVYSILQILNGNFNPSNGTFFSGNQSSTSAANSVVNGINTTGDVTNGVNLSAPSGVAYTPAQIRDAYGINSLSMDGTGQTIAIVDAYNDPNIFQALNLFDSQFTLTDSGPTLYDQYGDASMFLTVLNQSGQPDSLPATDPNGPGTDNWEVEEALDVEWIHAMAPGAQIVLVEANSQSLSDLMGAVATAASQPGVSVVSMSWGFTEGQSVFAADEANYDSVFNVPGVTFLASTGDYGAGDPEYPAFSPNVVAVGGTTLTLNADNSYNSETGWGYVSDSAGTLIASGGGISSYEPEPSYQQGVQSTGYRTTPDVSTVADPATGAWIADSYNLDPSNPFEVVGGTSLSAPVWAGLVSLVNQGRVAAGESTLNRSGPSETLQALYSLPQKDFNVISSGYNGYTANPGYNLVTGLGTPIAGSLVPDLLAYHGAGTTYSGPTVGPLQNASLTNWRDTWSVPHNVFGVFNAMTSAPGGFTTSAGETVTTSASDQISTAQYPAIIGQPDAPATSGQSEIQPVVSAATASDAPGPETSAIGAMPPTDDQAMHDAVLAGWSSDGSESPSTVAGQTLAVSGQARTSVLQGNVVDSVIDGLGSLPSLLGADSELASSPFSKSRRSNS